MITDPLLPDSEADHPHDEEASPREQPPARSRRRRSSAGSNGDTPPPAERILEAMLFAGRGPVTFEQARVILSGLGEEQFLAMIDALNAAYRLQGRPYALLPRDQGYVMTIKPSFLPLAERLKGPTRETRLSTAAIDVLSWVAYRQPIGKSEIDAIRGVDSGALLRQLLKHGLLSTERKTEGGRDLLYRTTTRFLKLFQLESLDDLPQTQELERL
ncbi:MAG TPA: SMC-Scp complex subunit ScpB [Gemmataceae bacterium]|jgi:segregation and condensation protein B|nr:SMC-Scp complex subunit ScpB [Gemmataceae bacterium]